MLSVSVGDFVYLSGPRKGQPAEIGKVKVLFQEPADGNEPGYFWLDVRAPRAPRARRARAEVARPVDRRLQDVAVEHRGARPPPARPSTRRVALQRRRRLACNGDRAQTSVASKYWADSNKKGV